MSSLKIPLYNIPDVDETFSIGALWRQWILNWNNYYISRFERGQEEKQPFTKHYTTKKTKYCATRTPQKTLVYSGRVSTSWYTSGTRRVTLVTNVDKSWMRKESDYNKQNIYVVICDTWIKFVSDLRQVSAVFSNNKTDRHDITEILLKVALISITLTHSWHWYSVTVSQGILSETTILNLMYVLYHCPTVVLYLYSFKWDYLYLI